MHKVDQYLDRVLYKANLSAEDHGRVRDELEDHLDHILSLGTKHNLTEEETMVKIEEEFGNADELGRAIARAHGEFRTYLKREVNSFKREIRLLPYSITIGAVMITLLTLFVIGYHKMDSTALEPSILKGHGAVAYKLTSTFEPGDIILFRSKGEKQLATVKTGEDKSNKYIVSRNGEIDQSIDTNQIIGRIFMTFR